MTNMNPFKPKTIREKGLRVHLVEQGINYTIFSKMVESRLSAAGIGRFFNRSQHTIDNWMEIYQEEKATKL